MKIKSSPTKFFQYAFEFDYKVGTVEFCRYVRQQLGNTKFDFVDKSWRFNEMSAVEIIKGRFPTVEIDPVIEMKYTMYMEQKEQEMLSYMKSEGIKRATDSDIEIKGINGELYPYQKVGVEFFMANNGRAILADTMGLGKTLQALAYITTTEQNKSLIVCPASVKYSWEGEVEKWTNLKSLVIDSATPFTKEQYEKHDVFIINYDILVRHGKPLTTFKWDCMICDEFHYVKNASAKRTKATKAIAQKIKRVLLLSGTPMLSRPVELFNGLNILQPAAWNNYMGFTARYCGGHYGYFGWDVKGATNINELQGKISRYFIRRTKDEVLKELPPKQFTDIPVDLPSDIRTEYNMAVADFQDYLKKVKKKSDKEVRRSMQAEKLVRLAALRQITTKGKVKHALNTINDIIDSGQKVVVFSVYNEPLKELKKALKDQAVILTGSVDAKDRKDIIEKFQEDDDVKVFLGGTKSAGVGITLTSAANVLFIDYSWVPADHAQAADRIHRIGQTASSVNIYQLYSRNTIDDYMTKLLAGKKALFDKLIENKDTNIQKSNITKDLIKMIEKQ